MNNKKIPGDPKGFIDDKAKARLALHVTEPAAAGACPSDEELAALVDDRLDGAKRNAVLEHLDACSQCYRQWLEISSLKEQEAGRSAATRHKRLYRTSGFAVAAMACLVFILWNTFLRSPEIADMLTASYKTAHKNRLTLEHSEPDSIPALPWETQRVRTRMLPPEIASHRAFTDGFMSGRKELLSKKDEEHADTKDWAETEQAPFFYLGRWCVLVQSACRSGQAIPAAFRHQQSNTLTQLAKDLKLHNQVEKTFELDLLAKAFKQIAVILEEEDKSGNICQLLEAELEAIKSILT